MSNIDEKIKEAVREVEEVIDVALDNFSSDLQYAMDSVLLDIEVTDEIYNKIEDVFGDLILSDRYHESGTYKLAVEYVSSSIEYKYS